jgi:hypothetical protein
VETVSAHGFNPPWVRIPESWVGTSYSPTRTISTFSSDIAYSLSPAASRAYRFTSLIFLSSVFGVPPVGV